MSSSRVPLPAVYLTFPAIDEEDEEDPFGCNGMPLPFSLSSLCLIIPPVGAVNPAAKPAPREVKPHEEGEEDEDDDDDIEVVTGAGMSSLSFMHSP